MNVAFIGHFTPSKEKSAIGSSAAGDLTQREISKALKNNYRVETLTSFVMKSSKSWPSGKFRIKGMCTDNIVSIGFINIYLVKHFIFSIKLFFLLIKQKPDLCVQYNSYFFENICLLIYRFFSKTKLAIIIQDLHVQFDYINSIKNAVKVVFERVSIRLAKRFDIIVPITKEMMRYFQFDPVRSFVFQGGVTGDVINLLRTENQTQLKEIAVFAGALEPHNGLDKLVSRWTEDAIEIELHIFGRGSLEKFVIDAGNRSKNIIFHGFQPEDQVLLWQSQAKWLICLRYSIGLNQDFFFPSKFYNILALNGNVLINIFNSLPTNLLPYLVIVNDNLSDLPNTLQSSSHHLFSENIKERHKILLEKYTWAHCINKLISML